MAPLPVAIRTCINQRIEKVVNTDTIAATAKRFIGSSIPKLLLICSVASDITVN